MARQKAKDILASHHPEYLDPAQDTAIRSAFRILDYPPFGHQMKHIFKPRDRSDGRLDRTQPDQSAQRANNGFGHMLRVFLRGKHRQIPCGTFARKRMQRDLFLKPLGTDITCRRGDGPATTLGHHAHNRLVAFHFKPVGQGDPQPF